MESIIQLGSPGQGHSHPSLPQIHLATAKCEIGKNMVVNGETESKGWLGTGTVCAGRFERCMTCDTGMRSDDD